MASSACDDALKESIMLGQGRVGTDPLLFVIRERQKDHETFSVRMK